MHGATSANYYIATANGFARQPAFAGEAEYDLCIVGGGFTGMSAALAAAEAGLRTVVLEAEHVGHGASGRNGGQLIPGLRWSASELVANFGIERARAIHDVVMEAVERVDRRIARHAIRCDLKSGHFEAAYKPAHLGAMRREVALLEYDFGRTGLTLVERNDVRRHVATDAYHGGVYDPLGGHFHPLNYVLGLADAALAAGVTIHEKSRVVSVEDGAGVVVRTDRGSVRARHAIIATDAWTEELAPALGRYTVPLMNYNVATVPLGTEAAAILPSDAAVADSRFVLNYFRLSADKRLIFGGGERYSQRPPADIGAFVRPFVAAIFPHLAAVPIEFGWGGIVSVTMNRLPHIGRRGNRYFAHGFSGHGALITTLAGEVMVEALRGTPERFDLLAGLPHRLFPGGRLLAKPLATLGLLYYALKDRL